MPLFYHEKDNINVSFSWSIYVEESPEQRFALIDEWSQIYSKTIVSLPPDFLIGEIDSRTFFISLEYREGKGLILLPSNKCLLP